MKIQENKNNDFIQQFLLFANTAHYMNSEHLIHSAQVIWTYFGQLTDYELLLYGKSSVS